VHDTKNVKRAIQKSNAQIQNICVFVQTKYKASYSTKHDSVDADQQQFPASVLLLLRNMFSPNKEHRYAQRSG
jgi:hypothetical protein